MDDKVFKIAFFGLARNEQTTLASIFKLAASRNRKYALVAEKDKADILLVDADDPKAMEAWKSFSVHNTKIPAVKVTKAATAENPQEPIIRRPMTLKRVLETLDKVTIEVLKYVPELIVPKDESEMDADTANTLEEAAASAKQVKKTGIKALVIDDSAAVRKSMDIQLSLMGMQIDFAESGEDALAQAKNTTDYDIIFLDIMMPGIDGYKVCKHLRSTKEFKQTPIIMLTGKGSRFDKLKGTMAGASLYLTKPVEQEQLHEVIKKFLPQVVVQS